MESFQIDKYRFSSSPALTLVGEDIVEARRSEALFLAKDLNKQGILIKDLIIKVPSLDVRNQLLNICKYIIEDMELYEEFNARNKVPVDDIIKSISVQRSLLEQWNDYIITYIYILSNPTYKHINDYIRIEENIDIIGLEAIDEDYKKEVADDNTGIVLVSGSKSSIVLTSKGEFKKITLGEKSKLGEEVSGKEKWNWRKHKFHMILLITLIISLIVIGIFKYTEPARTLIIETTSEITMEVNDFNRVINIKSSTEKGKKLIKDISVLDSTLDDSLLKLFEYANENNMIPEKGILITVVGDPVTYGSLNKTDNFLVENGIKYQFNNSGVQSSVNR